MLMPNSILEKKIKEQAEELFDSEPLQGHRDRFAGKLDDVKEVGNKKRTSFHKIISYISIAAVFAGCIFMLHRALNPDYQQEDEPLSVVQNYYSMLLQNKIEDIEQLLQQVDENDRDLLMKDIEDLFAETDFAIENSDENNAEFIVMTYSFKIEALQHIQTVLENNL